MTEDHDAPRLPRWAMAGAHDDPAVAGFRAGAALMALEQMLARPGLPGALLRDRLAMEAAEACLRRAGRPERMAGLRDEVHLLRPGERPGPGGAMVETWRAAAGRRLRRGGATAALPPDLPSDLPDAPVARAEAVLDARLEADPRAQAAALIEAEGVLSAALGWSHPLPLLAAHLGRADLRDLPSLESSCLRAVARAASQILPLAAELERRAARLRAVAPKLRAKASDAAVALFLSQDALSPARALSPVVQGSRARMSDRAARRLCDRLVELGAIRELSGRDSFRIYGL
ncbi:DUF1403 family protein [Mangrovicoccus algicola]|uniref:DUF1403 family protein n=1 Tax=Mangrovicoccus algicola TaxID=2771008 RepID=A0A8J6Z0K3_9RHOB|nr:DUF1403 family protein [Mangrovicoccus algicola]MBE3640369.1 DUF1403 family protein [Mangrovicoccus algicola]